MRFVEDINFEAIARWTITRTFSEFANLIDAAIGGRVNFDYVDGIAGANFGAGIANPAGFGHRLVVGVRSRSAIQRHREDTRDCSFPDSAMSAEDVAVRYTFLGDRILQGAGDVFLADN